MATSKPEDRVSKKLEFGLNVLVVNVVYLWFSIKVKPSLIIILAIYHLLYSCEPRTMGYYFFLLGTRDVFYFNSKF